MLVPPRAQLGPYEILSPLGSGGMGEVYRARDPRLERDVAIKILPERFATDPDLRLRFEREAKAAAALSHPHICSIFDVGVDAGLHFIVMEYLDGDTLADRMAGGLLPIELSIEYATQIADALAEAHRRGVVHRDLKPSNVMVVRTGIKLLDFGVARFRPAPLIDDTAASTSLPETGHGALLGTLQYMSPEQLDGRDIDARADIFSLGIVLYEMVTGVSPFAASSKAAVIAAILDRQPPVAGSHNLRAAATLNQLIAECLEKEPPHRPVADDVAHRLRAISAIQQAGSSPSPTRSRSKVVRSLAVLPFAATLRREGGDLLADGIAEGLITGLGSFRSLRVISPASARRFRGSDKRPSEIGAELRVDAVLRGHILESPAGRLMLDVGLLA